ncbi:hypothetical protein ABZ695_35555 [Streptomyces sp. NPDC006976]|uniref:hypothetical protein n=1 Tax=Streptomyces sp. NPDC006976 TaxID=3154311 RepID=UPI0033FFEEB2
MPSPRFPDIAEPGSVVIGTRFADSAGVQRRTANTEADELDRARQPGGLTAVSWFLSPDGETLLSCAQCSSDVAHDTYLRGSGFLPPLAGPPRYRLYRSSADTTDARTPGCLITAAFDVDGPERQRSFTEAVIAAQSQDDKSPRSHLCPLPP